MLTALFIALGLVGGVAFLLIVEDVGHFVLGHESWLEHRLGRVRLNRLLRRREIVRVPCDRIDVRETKRARRYG